MCRGGFPVRFCASYFRVFSRSRRVSKISAHLVFPLEPACFRGFDLFRLYYSTAQYVPYSRQLRGFARIYPDIITRLDPAGSAILRGFCACFPRHIARVMRGGSAWLRASPRFSPRVFPPRQPLQKKFFVPGNPHPVSVSSDPVKKISVWCVDNVHRHGLW